MGQSIAHSNLLRSSSQLYCGKLRETARTVNEPQSERKLNPLATFRKTTTAFRRETNEKLLYNCSGPLLEV